MNQEIISPPQTHSSLGRNLLILLSGFVGSAALLAALGVFDNAPEFMPRSANPYLVVNVILVVGIRLVIGLVKSFFKD